MRLLALIILFSSFLFYPQLIYAAEVSFSNSPQVIQKDEEITLDVVVSGAAPHTTNYIRAAFFHTDSPTSYFGYVFNNSSNWYNGTPSPIDPKQFLQIQIEDNGSWNGQLKIKTDVNSPYFNGNGSYFFKVGRYTASATSVSNWSQAAPIEIQGVLPTLSPTIKQIPTLKIIQTSAPVKPLANQKNIQTPIEKASVEVLKVDREDILPSGSSSSGEVQQIAVLGVTGVPRGDISPTTFLVSDSNSNTSSIFIVSGAVILIIGCGILLISAYKKQKLEEI